MSKKGNWISFNSFSGGEKSDLPPHLIPDNALLKALNVVTNKTGRIAKRGPIQKYLTSTTKDVIKQIGVPKSIINGTEPSSGYAVSAGKWYTFTLPNPPTTPRAGALSPSNDFTNSAVTIDVSQAVWGPSFDSFGTTMFPLSTVSVAPFIGFSRATSGTANRSTVANVTVTAGSQQIILSGVGVPSFDNSFVGQFVYANDNATVASTTKEYFGLITSVLNSTTVTVYPAPTISFAVATNIAEVSVLPFASTRGNLYESGGAKNVPSAATFGCVHQNRVIAVSERTTNFSGSPSTPVRTQKNVISWSAITGESASAANTGSDGFLYFLYAGWPKSQQITIDAGSITAVVSLDASNLLVLCSDKTLLLAGSLGTIIPAAGIKETSFNIRTVSQNVGCIDAASVQRTPVGVMFASRDGVYVTDGATFVNTMVDKIQQKWNVYNKSLFPSGNPVVGSAVIADTHYVVFTKNGPHFICNLYNDFSWSEISFENGLSAFSAEPSLAQTLSGYIGYQSFPATGIFQEKWGRFLDSSTDGSVIATTSNDNNSFVGDYTAVRTFRNSGTSAAPIYTGDAELTYVLSGSFSDKGVAVSGSGTRVAYTNNAGSVVIRLYSGGVWTTEATYVPSFIVAPGTSIAFAKSLDDRLIVGDPYSGANAGRVHILVRSGSTWTLETSIAGAATNQFGYSVDISSGGDRVAVGRPTSGTGTVSVYHRVGSVWTLNATLTSSTPYANEKLGTSVSISPDGLTIVSGAPYSSNGGRAAIWAYASGAWGATPTMLESQISGGSFGSSVDCIENRIIIGNANSSVASIYNNSPGYYVFVTNIYGATASSYGYAVNMTNDGNLIFAGAPNF